MNRKNRNWLISPANRFDARSRKEPDAVKNGNQAVFRQIRVAMLAVALPFVMAVGPVAGYFVGGWIGGQVGHIEWARVIGLVAGMAASVHQTILINRRIVREMR
jgi:hypothetical protein